MQALCNSSLSTHPQGSVVKATFHKAATTLPSWQIDYSK